jgi:hypothetical protein
MAYIIKRTDGAMVADMRRNPTGSSYTRNPEYARVYATREAAERDLCPENERICEPRNPFYRH